METDRLPGTKVQNPRLHLVAPNLYRLGEAGKYYALLKRGNMQFRRSLRTKDRKLTQALQALLSCLHAERQPQPEDLVAQVDSAKNGIAAACRRLGFPPFTHHDFRHFFATTCIEAGVDIPTVSRWLGHKDGGALAMRVYGHLRQEHSQLAIQKVTFSPRAAVS